MLHLLAVAAALAAPQIEVPPLFEEQLPRVNQRTQLAVLLPQRMPDKFDEYFPEGAATGKTWSLDLGAVEGCGGATACFIASFSGSEKGRPFGSRRVELARGRVGRYKPLSCGGSCSPPAISWREQDALYTFQAKEVSRRALVRMANSAIRHGRR